MSQHKLRLRRRTSSATVPETRDNPYYPIKPDVDNKFHYGRYRLRSGDPPAVQVASAYRKKIRLFADGDDDDDDEVIDSDAGGKGDISAGESMSTGMYECVNGDEDAGREMEKKKRKETVNENKDKKQQREREHGNGTGKQILVWKRRYDEVEVEITDELGARETTMSASDSVGIWKVKEGQEHRPGERDGDGTGRAVKTKTDYGHQSETIEDSDLDAPWEPDDNYDYYYPTWATPAPAIASYPLGKRPIRMFPAPSTRTLPLPSPSPPMSPLSPCPLDNDEDEEDDDEDDQDHDKDYEEDREDEEDDDEFVLPGPSRYRR